MGQPTAAVAQPALLPFAEVGVQHALPVPSNEGLHSQKLATCATNLETWHIYENAMGENFAASQPPGCPGSRPRLRHAACQTHIRPNERWYMFAVIPPVHDPPRGPISGLAGCANQVQRLVLYYDPNDMKYYGQALF